jgi:hypothetical protein
VALTLAVIGPDPAQQPGGVEQPPVAVVLPTRAPDLALGDVARIAHALGIAGSPVADGDTWLAADPARSLVLRRASDSWSALYTDSSVLLEPPAPGTRLPAAVSEPAPSASDAEVAARTVLQQAGVIPGRWMSFTGAPSTMPTACRPVPTPYDCNQVRLQTRHVVFVLIIAGRATTIEWEVLVGPGNRILDVVGRIATVGRSS